MNSPLKNYLIGFCISLLLISCQQASLSRAKDYSSLLPQEKLLYLTLSVQSGAKGFPYREIQSQMLGEQLTGFVSRRLLRSQLALGVSGDLYAVNQLLLDNALFAKHLAKEDSWQALPQPPKTFLHRNGHLALQMPERNLLYFSASGQPVGEMERFTERWRSGGQSSPMPQRFRDLQDLVPLLAYSPRIIPLITSPLLQKAFPLTLGPFARISEQFPLSEALFWVEMAPEASPKAKGPYRFHLEFATGSLVLSKGLEAGFRLFLPGLLLRSKQEFIRRQLPNVVLQSGEQSFKFSIPIDQTSLEHMVEQFRLQIF